MTEKSSSVQAILRKNRQVSSVSIKTRTLPDGLRIEQVGMPLKKFSLNVMKDQNRSSG